MEYLLSVEDGGTHAYRTVEEKTDREYKMKKITYSFITNYRSVRNLCAAVGGDRLISFNMHAIDVIIARKL
jgi:hypothetical protein